MKKYHHNLSVIKYLEGNKVVNEKYNFKLIKNTNLSEIFREYLESKEIGLEISDLKKDNENDKYIKKYIIKVKTFINFVIK